MCVCVCVCVTQRARTHHSRSGKRNKQTDRQTNRQMNGHSLKLVECKAEQKHDKEMVSVPEHFKVRSPVRQRGKRTQTSLSKIACEAKEGRELKQV